MKKSTIAVININELIKKQQQQQFIEKNYEQC